MLFEHRGFSIECSVEVVGPDYAGQAVISRLVTDESGKAFMSGPAASIDPASAMRPALRSVKGGVLIGLERLYRHELVGRS